MRPPTPVAHEHSPIELASSAPLSDVRTDRDTSPDTKTRDANSGSLSKCGASSRFKLLSLLCRAIFSFASRSNSCSPSLSVRFRVYGEMAICISY